MQPLNRPMAALLDFEKAFEQPGTFLHITQSVFDMRMPQGLTPEQSDRFLKEKMRGHFEDIWAQRPLHSLKGDTPLSMLQAIPSSDARCWAASS